MTPSRPAVPDRASALRRTAVVALSCLALVVSACGGGPAPDPNAPRSVAEAGGLDQLAEAARAGGEVSLYVGTTQSETREWADAFTERFGVDVTIYRASSTTMYERWAQETQAGQHRADIVIQSTYQLTEEAASRGWLAPFEPSEPLNYRPDTWPENSPARGVAYPLYLTTGAVVWNSAVVTPEQEALLRADPVAAMADPSFQGLVALNGPSGGTTVGDYANIILNQADRYGWQWLDRVAANRPAAYESGIPLADALVAGEYAVTLGTDSIAVDLVEDGAPLEFAYPEPASAAPWMIGMAADAPNPAGAALFMEWANSAEGHDLFSGISGGLSSRQDWEDDRAIRDVGWYREPADVWMDWRTDPRLQGEQLNEFINRVNSTIGF